MSYTTPSTNSPSLHSSVISKLLGHSSVPTTARYLDHLTNGQAVTALQGVVLPDLATTSP